MDPTPRNAVPDVPPEKFASELHNLVMRSLWHTPAYRIVEVLNETADVLRAAHTDASSLVGR